MQRSQFAEEVIGIRHASVGYSRQTGDWSFEGMAHGADARFSPASEKTDAAKILDAVLNNRKIRITKKIGDNIIVVDQEATTQANTAAKAMRSAFRDWIFQDDTRRSTLTALYNERYNNYVPPKYNGEHLSFPGMSNKITLRPHQKNAIFRIISQGDVYLNHSVGTGKTFTMIAAAMEEKRLGLVQKPMFVVPNHMLEQFQREFLQLYPAADIMVATEEHFNGHNRKRFMGQAALNRPDAIIVTHSSFERIGVSPEFQQQFMREQIQQWNAILQEIKESKNNDESKRVTVKNLQAQIERTEQRLKKLLEAKSKDSAVYFDELGVDRLYVDEAHEYRKLSFATKLGNVKGIDPNGSQKAMDLFMKLSLMRQLNPNTRRAYVAASGTPVVNTMGELYTIQRMFRGEEMEEDNLEHFDNWAKQFGEVVEGLEQNAAGGFDLTARFSRFVNMPELMGRILDFMDVVDSRDMKAQLRLPDVVTGGREVIAVPPQEEQSAYQDRLAARIAEVRGRSGPPEKGADNILAIIGDARLAAIDLRFVDPDAENDPNSKLNHVIDAIAEAYHATANNEYRTDGETDPIKGSSILLFSDLGFGEGVAKSRGFDAKAYVEEQLKAKGVNPKHIAFVRDYNTHAKKGQLFADMRAGKKRIMIGGKNMETGVNVQKRLTHLFHLDTPWYPAVIEQREGRILRQGNQNNKVVIQAFAAKDSYDATGWDTVARKARFIRQVMAGDTSVRTLDDISEAGAFEQASAMVAKDPRVAERYRLSMELERLNRQKRAAQSAAFTAKSNIPGLENAIKFREKRLALADEALANHQPIEAGKFTGEVKAKRYTNRDEFGKALTAAYNKAYDAQRNHELLARINGRDITIQQLPSSKTSDRYAALLHYDVPDENGSTAVIDSTQRLPDTASAGITTRLVNRWNALPKNREKLAAALEAYQLKLRQSQQQAQTEFTEQDELTRVQQEYDRLTRELEDEAAPPRVDEDEILAAQMGQILEQDGESKFSVSPVNVPESELNAVKEHYQNTEQWLKAPNGAPTKLNERQWLQVRTPAFKAWFGDWEKEAENASKVIDENGEPLIVYHGTEEKFTEFDRKKLGALTYDNANKTSYAATAALGFWFNTNKAYGESVPHLAVFLNLREPQDFSSVSELARTIEYSGLIPDGHQDPASFDDYAVISEIGEQFVRDYLPTHKDGTDGITLNDEEYGGTSYVVFDPNQIKSATDNVGTFSAGSNDIRFSINPKSKTLTKKETALRDSLIGIMRNAGIDVITDIEEGQRVLDLADSVHANRREKPANDTGLPENKSLSKTAVVPFTSTVSIRQNLNTMVEDYENRDKKHLQTFISELGRALTAKNHGSASQYVTIEAKNGAVVTIRLANHNASTANFDNAGRDNAISIVISRKANQGINNDGRAHVIEFFYSDKKLRRAGGRALASIAKGLQRALYSGEYKDATGLAEVQEVNGLKYFRTSKGEVYGYTLNGKIYLDTRIADSETAIHEYTHLWAEALRQNNPKAWRGIASLLKGTPLWTQVVNDYPHLKNNSDIAEEVLARYSGKRGAERVRAGIKNPTLRAKFKQALQDFWGGVAELFGLPRYRNANAIADAALRDLLHGVKPEVPSSSTIQYAIEEQMMRIPQAENAQGDNTEDNPTRFSVAPLPPAPASVRKRAHATANRIGGTAAYIKAKRAGETKLSYKQWVTAHDQAFKDWFGDWQNPFGERSLFFAVDPQTGEPTAQAVDDFMSGVSAIEARMFNALFSVSPPRSTTPNVPKNLLSRAIDGVRDTTSYLGSDQFKTDWLNRQHELERIAREIEGNHGKKSKAGKLARDVVNEFKLYNGRAEYQLKRDVQPMQEALAQQIQSDVADKLSRLPAYANMKPAYAHAAVLADVDEIIKYVLHGEERNYEIAIRTDGADMAGSGRTDAEIEAARQKFLSPEYGNGQMIAYAKSLYRSHLRPIIDYSDQILKDAGLLTDDMLAARPDYEWYVPLYGAPMLDAGDQASVAEYVSGAPSMRRQKNDVLRNVTHSAQGRHGTEARSVFENIFTQAVIAVRRAQMQEPKRALWRLLETEDGRAAFQAETKQGKIKGAERVFINEDGEVEARVEKGSTSQSTGNVITLQDGNDVYFMEIGNDEALKAIRNFNDDVIGERKLSNGWYVTNQLNKFYASTKTRYNVSFPLINKIRDSLQQMNYLLIDAPVGGTTTGLGLGDIGQAARNLTKRTKLVAKAAKYNFTWTAAGVLRDSEFHDWLQRYGELGGITTWARYLGANQYQNFYESINEAARSWGNPKKGIKALSKMADNINEYLEMTSRVAAFRALVEAGVPEKEAAVYVKDLMNFETKGAKGIKANSMFAFFTTSMYDKARMLQSLKTTEGKVMLAAMVGFYLTLYAALAALGGDDDYGEAYLDKHSFGVASRYLIIPLPGKKGAGLRLPIAYGLPQVANTLALTLRRSANGSATLSETGSNLVNGVLIGNASPINPSSIDIADHPIHWAANTFLPSWFSGWVYRPAANVSWTGGKIYNDSQFRAKGMMNYESGFDSTGDVYKGAAKTLYDLSGGIIDAPPELFSYYTNEIFGGSGTAVANMGEWAIDSFGGGDSSTDIPGKSIPILDRFVQTRPSKDRNDYYDLEKELSGKVNRAYNNYKRGKAIDRQTLGRDEAFLKRIQQINTAIQQQRKAIRRAKAAGADSNELKKQRDRLDTWSREQYANTVHLYEGKERAAKP